MQTIKPSLMHCQNIPNSYSFTYSISDLSVKMSHIFLQNPFVTVLSRASQLLFGCGCTFLASNHNSFHYHLFFTSTYLFIAIKKQNILFHPSDKIKLQDISKIKQNNLGLYIEIFFPEKSKICVTFRSKNISPFYFS